MKKITFLMIAAGLAVSATAINKKAEVAQRSNFTPVSELQLPKLQPGFAKQAFTMESLVKASKKSPNKVNESYPDSIYPYFLPQDNYMRIGMTEGGGSISGAGFASSYGTLTFYNNSMRCESHRWIYSDLMDFTWDEVEWDEKESSDYDLTITPKVGYQCMGPYLEGFRGNLSALYENPTEKIMFGGGALLYGYGASLEEPCGLTFYHNFGMANPEGYSGSVVQKYVYCIEKRPTNYTRYGASTQWVSTLQNRDGIGLEINVDAETGVNDTIRHEIKNVGLQNFMVKLPKPESTYVFSRAWAWMGGTVNEDTELVSYIYPIDEEGNVLEEQPIAQGAAALQKGSIDLRTTGCVVFNYEKLDEDGDPVLGDIYVDGPVAITIEGFAGNDALSELYMVSGYAGPFNVNAAYDANDEGTLKSFLPTPQLYVTLTYDRDGEAQSITTYDSGWYYFDQTLIDENDPDSGMVNPDAISPYYMAQFFLDAKFPYIYAESGEKSVDFELEGGETEIMLSAYYYNIKACLESFDGDIDSGYEMSVPEWVDVTIGDSDGDTGLTPMTISVDATDSPRNGVITIEGLGATFSLPVNQGESGVATISLEKGAEYYDLMGRKVASPDKGIYIKKNGKTSTKVIF